ncbi:maltose alpha-D-glucosyltransferase [Rhodopseudomonas palustris]|uniref:maltose alpha-D-glucosyltransferase n=1 Tax=Rhodopseudomonas palustris TaxID=1076 RepID=UPI0020CC26F5|nr:maltose alpha-D-glucosyltransferase [Rhodopseudomonas palustris]MCP9629892.1 maltose alpha-D-glucosyltransferase [Rhodopseudomonas palustris]
MNLMSPIDETADAVDHEAADEIWYKDAIIYQLHVKAFADSNNDGIGDFAGLTEKLDYLQDLGVTTLWLLPFYPSPQRDDGYDIADYGSINPDFGTMKDFRRFIAEAKRRGLRVITELVINHTSDQHAWFKRARRSPKDSSARDWYVWSDTDQKYQGTRIIFTDTEKSNWTWDPEAGQYYWHRFFSHQPDLNFDNPRVVSAVVKVMKRWLDTGVDGFRLDAIPYLCERDGTNNENLPETHAVIKKLRAELDAYAKGKVLLAEANQWPEDVQEYFGQGDECHMAYHFPLMPRIYMAIAQEDRFPITDIMRQTPEIPANCQWAMFLRNHDELTLEMVTDVERDYLWKTYAADPRARINLGIRRRLAPLMDNDRRKIELMNSLLLSFPGTPIIYYGDEIGMGDNIYLGDRNGVRTPMQWSPDRNGGFSRADPARLYAPPIMDPVYGYASVNVEAQARSLSSLLSATKRLISVRKSTPAFGRGSMTFIRPSNRSVLAYVRQYEDEVILCVANLSRSAQPTELDLSPWKERIPQEMLGRTKFPAIGELPYMITLAPYGFYWFKLEERGMAEHVAPAATALEFETLVVPVGATWMSLARTRGVFERDVLPAFLSRTRWFPERSMRAIQPRVTSAIPFSNTHDNRPWLAFFEASVRGVDARYVLPMQINWVRFDRERYNPRAFAAVRQGSREGTLLDVAGDIEFTTLLLDNLREGVVIENEGDRLEFRPGSRLAEKPAGPYEQIRAVSTEQSNSTALVGEDYVIKLYRRLESGTNPEIEMGRFLTEVAGYGNTPSLLGSVELIEGDKTSAIAVVHEFVANQGDGWVMTSGYLDRYVDDQRVLMKAEEEVVSEELAPYLRYMEQTGRRVAEMHIALASHPEVADFAPEPISGEDVGRWTETLSANATRVLDELGRKRESLKDGDRALVDEFLALRDGLARRLPGFLGENGGLKIRHHGDFHLGQMLIVKEDVFIIDFEGEPRRSQAERRAKASAARDVAGLVRSIDYSTTAALERALKTHPEEAGKIAAALDAWRERATDAFLTAYRETMAGSPVWPADQAAADRLLDFFLIEKALYEIEYELAHRPDWLRVPLAGILRILTRQPEETT